MVLAADYTRFGRRHYPSVELRFAWNWVGAEKFAAAIRRGFARELMIERSLLLLSRTAGRSKDHGTLEASTFAGQPPIGTEMPACEVTARFGARAGRCGCGRLLAVLAAALGLGLVSEASATEPEPGEGPLLVALGEPRWHEPPPEGYAEYELLSRVGGRKDFELKLAPEDSWQLVPHASPLRVEVPRQDYRELDTGRPRLTTSALDANDQRSVVGGRLLSTRPWRAPGSVHESGRLHTEARLLWLCEFIKNEDAPTAFFAPGDSNIFVTQGLSYGSNWALLGGRVSWDLAGGLKAFAAYDAQVNSLETFHIGSTGLGYSW